MIADTADLSMESSTDDVHSDDSDNGDSDNIEEIFTTTRRGRLTTNWKASKYVSTCIFINDIELVLYLYIKNV